jgi:hypothetical protein
MKKTVLSLGIVLLATGGAFAQNKKRAPKAAPAAKAAPVAQQATTVDPHAGHDHADHNHDGHDHAAPGAQGVDPATTSLTTENMAFNTENHNFGNVAEGPTADFTFTFRNTGKEPIILQRVQPACGCTAADYTKEPILPGKTGYVKASYSTQGRPGPFTKTVSVLSNAGQKTLTFTGNVEKAPTSSVPANGSMMRNN